MELETGTIDLIAKKENGVGYLIMNRPDARNAMSDAMNKALQ
jgi:2-(1,2-epoxy-1,2-dihydrophenyl)acetyl-CoA isomerase